MKISEINDEAEKLLEKIQELKAEFKRAIADKSIDLKTRWDFFCASNDILSEIVDDGTVASCISKCFSRRIDDILASPEDKYILYTSDLLGHKVVKYLISEVEYKEAVLANNLKAFWI